MFCSRTLKLEGKPGTKREAANVYRWAMEILRRDGTRVGQKVVSPDFAPVIECARLSYLRRHGPAAAADYDRPVEIDPAWSDKLGEPYVAGLRTIVAGEPVEELPGAVMFKASAVEASTEFVKSGELEADSTFLYLVTAYSDEAPPSPPTRERFQLSSLPVPVPISNGFWPSEARDNVRDIGVILPRHLLDEIVDLTVAKRGVETGGVLLGHLKWDHQLRELFIETTEQIHARSAVGDEKRLQFTADCWAEVRSALALRQRGESIIGWWHSHPARNWCAECPRERQEDCSLQNGFLSDHDKTLHRTIFPRAFTVALVATDSALGDVQFAMFGWKRGVLTKRAYNVIGGNSRSQIRSAVDPEMSTEGEELCEHQKSMS